MKRTQIIIFTLLIFVTTIAVLSSIFTLRKAIIFVILISVGIVFTAIPLFHIGKMIVIDVIIAKNGQKKNGKCIKYIRGNRVHFGSMLVEWKDDEGKTKHREFIALRLRFKCPYNVKVYILNNAVYLSNLGILTILNELLYFLLFLFIWSVCSMGTIHLLLEIV